MAPEDATVSLYTLTDTLGIHVHPSDMGKKIIKKNPSNSGSYPS